MKILFAWFLLALIACSGSEKTAGSVSETTNGSIAGVWKDSTGALLAGATVHVYSSYGALNARSADTALFSTVTGADGSFEFPEVPAGTYTLLATTTDGLSLKVDVIQPDSQAQDLGTRTPVSPGSLTVDFQEGDLKTGDQVCLPGTGICAIATQPDVEASSIQLSGIPQGDYNLILLWPISGNVPISLLETTLTIGNTPVVVIPVISSSLLPSGGFGAQTFAGALPEDTVLVTNHDELKAALESESPLVVLVSDTIKGNDKIRIASAKILQGTTARATLSGFGLQFSKVHDGWVRNIDFTGGKDDAISIENGSTRIRIEHNTFANFGDGLIDIKTGSDSVTLAWNVFSDNKFTCLIGHADTATTDSGKLRVSIHHNWFNGTSEMNPRVRFGTVHLYNNLFTDNSGYGVASTQNAKIVLESNVFWNVKKPTLVRHTSPLDGELSETGNAYYNSGTPQVLGNAFIASDYYSYTPDATDKVEMLVRLGAGHGR